MSKKEMIVYKENFISKIKKFFKNLFGHKKRNNDSIETVVNENIKEININKKEENFLKDIKVDTDVSDRVIKKKTFLEEIDGNIEMLNMLSIDTVVLKIWEYTELFIKRIFPVSFSFITLSNLLIEYNFIQLLQRIFRIKSPYIYIFILSLISGFPAGAIYIKEMIEKEYISIEDANRIIMFCHFPNPLFVINSVGSILNSKTLSIYILISIITSNFAIMLFSINKKKCSYIPFNNIDSFSNSLSKTIINSIKTIILIYGISLFFFLISVVINCLFHNTFIYIFINFFFTINMFKLHSTFYHS